MIEIKQCCGSGLALDASLDQDPSSQSGSGTRASREKVVPPPLQAPSCCYP
jgi:hypothetical protein